MTTPPTPKPQSELPIEVRVGFLEQKVDLMDKTMSKLLAILNQWAGND